MFHHYPMELRHIRYFLAVAAEASFTRAAARVGIGQSPLSQQIRDLEREVGARLFRRVAYGAELTAAGQAFFDEVRAMPEVAERAIHAALRAERGEIGRLHGGFTPSSAFNPAVTDALRTYRETHPDVQLHLTELNTTGLVAGLRDGTLDVTFLRPEAPGSQEFELRPFVEEPMLAALPASHPVARQEAVTIAQLATLPLLLFPRAVGPVLFDTVMDAFRAAGLEPRMGQVVPQVASTLNFVAAAMGISIVPASMAAVRVSGVCYRPLQGATPVARIALATRRGERRAIVRNFLACAAADAAR